MPLYEYRCKACGERFEKLVRSECCAEIQCPRCGSSEADRLVSSFGVAGRGGASTGSSGGCAPSG
jgi:putative FmdB family regulatory protein